MNTAAALAAGSIAFREADPAFAHSLLEHAEQLYSFGERCPGDYIKGGAFGGWLAMGVLCVFWGGRWMEHTHTHTVHPRTKSTNNTHATQGRSLRASRTTTGARSWTSRPSRPPGSTRPPVRMVGVRAFVFLGFSTDRPRVVC